MADRSHISFDGLGLDKVVEAFGGGWMALLALTVICLCVVAASSARPFFGWLTARNRDKLRHERFIKKLDQKIEDRARREAEKPRDRGRTGARK